jgi:dTDP-4-dehydrorhamnose 3,5-epimerase-like enzyme
MRVDDCKIIKIPKIFNVRGNLSFIEANKHIPFEIKRIYYLYDIPAESVRGGHAHKNLHQLMIAVSGSFDITLDDGVKKKTISLTRSYEGLYISPMIWRDLNNFSSGCICLVLASDYFDESDYYRDYKEFIANI